MAKYEALRKMSQDSFLKNVFHIPEGRHLGLASLLVVFILMGYPIHIDTISMSTHISVWGYTYPLMFPFGGTCSYVRVHIF